MTLKPKTDIEQLFFEARRNETYLKICAPMVRYSKLQFRSLVRRFGVELCFTPMILADSFCQSSKARLNEFSTSSHDTPLIVQFAAKTTHDFVGASELVYPYADGVDLNCGCPQRWAIKDGYGCGLLSKPETVHSLIREFKNRLPNDFSVSVKVRLLKDLKNTIEMCRQLEHCGITFLTAHGRTVNQRSSENININMLKEIKNSTNVYFTANGGVKSLSDANNLYSQLKCDGIMAAQGMLSNPSMFEGTTKTTLNCVQEWLNISKTHREQMIYQCYHHHLVFMMEKILNKKQKQIFNNLNSYSKLDNYIEENLGLKPESQVFDEEIVCDYNPLDYRTLQSSFYKENLCNGCMNDFTSCICYSDKQRTCYDHTMTNGKYFNEVITEKEDICDLDHMDSTLFD